jgi:outer membrane protein assembly factor BamB
MILFHAYHGHHVRFIVICFVIFNSIFSIGMIPSHLKNPATSNTVMATIFAQSKPRLSTAPNSSDPTGDEWPMFHGALNHTGVTKTMPVRGNGPLWSFYAGIIESSPAVVGKCVFVGCADKNVYCLNATTGVRVWNYTTNNSVYSSPAIADGRVYVGSSDHNIYCLNATTGARI